MLASLKAVLTLFLLLRLAWGRRVSPDVAVEPIVGSVDLVVELVVGFVDVNGELEVGLVDVVVELSIGRPDVVVEPIVGSPCVVPAVANGALGPTCSSLPCISESGCASVLYGSPEVVLT